MSRKSEEKDALGDRMKGFEAVETERRLTGHNPIYVRLDGRGFSKFTRGMKRPFDEMMSKAMIETTRYLVAETHARIGYTQSDEISLTYWLDPEDGVTISEKQSLFDGKLQKLTSVLAGMASSYFTRLCLTSEYLHRFADARLPHFDARVFELPSIEEGANAFLWRALDAKKNSISMAAHDVFSHKSLQGVTGREKVVMLAERGIDWDAYPNFFKYGTFLRRTLIERPIPENERMVIPEAHRPAPGTLVWRSAVRDLGIGDFLEVTNRAAMIYHGEAPVYREAVAT